MIHIYNYIFNRLSFFLSVGIIEKPWIYFSFNTNLSKIAKQAWNKKLAHRAARFMEKLTSARTTSVLNLVISIKLILT